MLRQPIHASRSNIAYRRLVIELFQRPFLYWQKGSRVALREVPVKSRLLDVLTEGDGIMRDLARTRYEATFSEMSVGEKTPLLLPLPLLTLLSLITLPHV
jgi:hypothetical protein